VSIGNALNSLPIAYAPLSGAGADFAWVTAVLNAGLSFSPSAILVADDSISISVTSTVEAEALRVIIGGSSWDADGGLSAFGVGVYKSLVSLDALSSVAFESTGLEVNATALLLVDVDTAIAAMRVRTANSDFRSPYLPPGSAVRSNIVNANALGAATLNGTSGYVLRSFITSFTANGNAIFAPDLPVSLASQASPSARLVADGVGIMTDTLTSITSTPNAIFSPSTPLSGVITVIPFAMAYRPAGTIIDQIIASASFSGVNMAGGKLSATVDSGISPDGIAGVDGRSTVNVYGVISPIPTYVYLAASSFDVSAVSHALATRSRTAAIVMPARTVFGGEPWEALDQFFSYVYASGWSGDKGLNIVGTIVYGVFPEDIVYQIAPESIVYGTID